MGFKPAEEEEEEEQLNDTVSNFFTTDWLSEHTGDFGNLLPQTSLLLVEHIDVYFCGCVPVCVRGIVKLVETNRPIIQTPCLNHDRFRH